MKNDTSIHLFKIYNIDVPLQDKKVTVYCIIYQSQFVIILTVIYIMLF